MSLMLAGCGGARTESSTTTPEPETVATEPTETSTADEPASETTSSDALARYGDDVMAMISRHWTVPAAIPPSEVSSLEARIEVTVDDSQFPTAYRIVESSGNALFDASVEEALQALAAAAERLPDPPAGLDDRGHVRLRLRGRRAD